MLLLLYILLACIGLYHASPLYNKGNPIHVNLDPWLNNKAFGANADFDGVGTYFELDSFQHPELLVPYISATSGIHDNIQQSTANDVVIPLQQQAAVANVTLGALYMLVSSSHGPCTLDITITYHDATRDETTLSLPDWQDQYTSQMERYQAIQYTLSNSNQGALFSVPIFVSPSKIPVSITIPSTAKEDAIHIFAITAYTVQPSLLMVSIRPTHEWINDQHQVVQVNLHNLHSKWVQNARLHVRSSQVSTIEAGHIKAIAPGHTRSVRVIVQAHANATSDGVVSVQLTYGSNSNSMTIDASLSFLTSIRYTSTSSSVQQHRPPNWLKQSKFGIFIHWGLYSVPSWAPVGKSYAEWYWWRMNRKDDAAFDYHRQHYGQNFEYDDFLAQWKPTDFDPRAWLRLVDQSRAKYFVFTTKHHDGIALFDTHVTQRSTMHLLQPNRDFVKELMDVAERDYPQLKRGLYFSLPEWYHPKYKDDSLGWQGPPMNPYTGQRVPYTGSRTIHDFVNELQVPQFQELVQYKPDILWCDIGGIHNSSVWQSNYFNQALASGQQVAVNDRCGDSSASDFTTVEYKAVTDTPTRFWEATRGMDPYSFGYNRETTPEAYASVLSLTRDLVDAVSRGGNFLLNIGPKASGEVPQPMVDRLTSIGTWLDAVGESVFDSVPYWIASAQDELRFTASQDGTSVYVFSFSEQTMGRQSIEVTTPLPNMHDSVITLLNDNSTAIQWRHTSAGSTLLEFNLPRTASDILVFKISCLLKV
ncbi:glycoside hydrolase family 29 protein [Mucor ambiguus]|uniref:alpha-L-fucosidase n=1 Tax=Mucor ambiguus TaxID=91626 RepID=A0A0C9LRK5_9FUNG|nr:glycoside hydrolase family 29 protein [Mucor ambiguus]